MIIKKLCDVMIHDYIQLSFTSTIYYRINNSFSIESYFPASFHTGNSLPMDYDKTGSCIEYPLIKQGRQQ